MICKFCKGKCKKDGFQKNGSQRYKCKVCHRRQQGMYKYNAYDPGINKELVKLTKEGVSIRGTARMLKISIATTLKRILSIADSIPLPVIVKKQVYEVDELKTFVRRKSNHIWVAYAINRKTKQVVSFSIGPHTHSTLKSIIKTLSLSEAKRIHTDRLKNYKSLIDPAIHKTTLYGTNHVERHNLILRTHLKRLNRRTICFSRKLPMLYSILKIYFRG